MLYMLWKECMPANFYRHICKEKNALYLNGKNMLQPKVAEIINDNLDEETNNYNEMRNNLSQYKNIFQYVYSNVFPEIYYSTERREFDLKSSFHIMFKTYKRKKKMKLLGKSPKNYEEISNDVLVYEQKPIKIDNFNEAEQKEIKEHIEKRKLKRREVAENNKPLTEKKRNKTKIKRRD